MSFLLAVFEMSTEPRSKRRNTNSFFSSEIHLAHKAGLFYP